MWPFKRRKTFAEFVRGQPPAPCGQQVKHYEWTVSNGMPCPLCAGIRAHAISRKQKDDEEIRLSLMITNSLARALSAPAVPEGWKLVPIEPTPEMLAACNRCFTASDLYKEMLAAAPSPEEPQT